MGSGYLAERAWAAVLALAEGHYPDVRDAMVWYGLDSEGNLAAVAADSPDAVLQWQPLRGWTVCEQAGPAAAAMLDLYLPVCAATEQAPVVVGHLGQSLDGFIALTSGDSDYVTGPANITHLHRMRALCDAVVVGAETVSADDPVLTARHAGGRNPTRVVIDPMRRLAATHGVFTDGLAPTLVVCDEAHADRDGAGAANVVGVPCSESGLDLGAVLDALRARSLYSVFVEGGGKTVSAFLERGLLDRLQVAIAPIVIGRGRPGLTLAPRDRIDDCLRLAPQYYAMGSDVLCDCDLRAVHDADGVSSVRCID
jgi:diaminohydroxyphosphoribosylaminopyrimidine deaminase/5-amino-6-(5-phosphoribosylamino)uracil reductase